MPDAESIEQTPTFTILDKWLMEEQRIVMLNGDVDHWSIGDLIKQLIILDKRNGEDITLYVNTNGGEAYEVLGLYDAIRALKSTVHLVVQGKAFSAGAFIAALCATGDRRAGKHSSFMIHSISSWSSGKIADMETDVLEIKRLEKKLKGLLQKHTKIKAEAMKDMFRKDHYFDSGAALKFGIIDEVV